MNLARKLKLYKNFNIPFTLNSKEQLIIEHINAWLDDLIIYPHEEFNFSLHFYLYYMKSNGKWILKKGLDNDEYDKGVVYYNVDLWFTFFQTFFKEINLNKRIPQQLDADVDYIIKHCIETKLNLSIKKIGRLGFSNSSDIEKSFLLQHQYKFRILLPTGI